MTAKAKTAPKKTKPRPVRARRPSPLNQFVQGNAFWKARSKHGRDKIFADPEVLKSACQEYFDWVEEHPMYEAKAFAYEGDVTIEAMPKMRVMTVGALAIFLDISISTWFDYRKRPGFSEVCMNAEQVIREQKFAGAASGFFNHAIIARDLGLADKRELTGPNGGAIPVVTGEMTPAEAAAAYARTLSADEDEDDE